MGKSKYNNAFKGLTIKNGTLERVKQYKKECYYEDKEIASNHDLGILDSRSIGLKWFNYSQVDIKRNYFKDCALRLLRSKNLKVSRANKKIEDIILNNDNPVFITLTFTNDILNSTTPQTRRRYVARFLKENCNSYVANIDYSPKKGREHYHAIIDCPISMEDWKINGFAFTERIRKHTTSRKIANYINKLTLHAFKVEDTPRLIYSRN